MELEQNLETNRHQVVMRDRVLDAQTSLGRQLPEQLTIPNVERQEHSWLCLRHGWTESVSGRSLGNTRRDT
ncbi:MAG: hypothetical protein V1850_03790 [Candidatus Bathyarchaeota archaeon]